MSESYKIGVEITARGASSAAAELNRIDKNLNTFGRSAASATGSAKNLGSTLASSLAFANPYVIAASLALAGLALTAREALKSIETASKYSSAEKGLIAVSKSAELAKDKIAELESVASDTQGLKFLQAIQAQRNLEAAGIEAEVATGSIKAFANALAIVGGSEAEFDGVLTALTQIASKSQVSAEEINQLAERIPQIRKAMQGAYGTSDTEKLQKLGVQPAEFIKKITEELNKLPKAQSDATGGWENFTDAVDKAYREVGKPALPEVGRILNNLAVSIENNKDVWQSWGESLNNTVTAIGKVSDAINYLSDTSIAKLLKYLPTLANYGATGYVFGDLATQLGNLSKAFSDVYFPTATGSTGVLNAIVTSADAVNSYNKAITQAQFGQKNASFEFRRLTDQIKAQNEAAKEAEKIHQTLNDTITNLAGQILYFGDETTVAATKQQLFNRGIFDFNSGLARQAVRLSQQLDRLKEYQKVSDYLKELRQNAQFEMSFPNASELDKFEDWIKRNVTNFAELRGEIEATRRVLQDKQLFEGIGNYLQAGESYIAMQETFRRTIDSEIRGYTLESPSLFKQKMETLAASLLNIRNASISNIAKNKDGINVFPQDFSNQVEGFISTIEQLEQLGNSPAQVIETFIKYLENLGKVTYEVEEEVDGKLQKVLRTFQLFSRTTATEFVDQLRILRTTANNEELQQGFQKLDEILSNLGLTIGGFGAKSELERLNEELSNPAVTRAIEKRAKAVHMSAQAYKDLLLAQAAKSAEDAATSPQGTNGNVGGGIFDQLDEATGKVRTFDDVLSQLGQTASDIFLQMGQGLGTMLENWVLLGDAAGISMKKMVASVLAGVAAQSATLAIFHTAMGIAALTPWGAAMYGSATLHFKAAALWGAIAVATALAGRAVAGNAENGQSSGQNNQPDYYTASPNRASNIQTTNPQNRQMQISVEKLASAVDKMHQRISGMRPGDVLTAGINQKKGLVAQTVTKELRTNSSGKRDLQRTMGLK